MYEKLDSFMNVDTWHTTHPLDEERFFVALHRIVREKDFHPDNMGDYMRQKIGVDQNNDDHHYNRAIDRCVSNAWAVKGYLDANKL